MGCQTMTRLDPVTNPTFDRTVDDLAARRGSYARLATPVPPLQPIGDPTGPYRIVGHEPGWLTLSDPVTSARVPLTQVQSVSTYDPVRGALEGAISAGAVTFVLVFALTLVVYPRPCAADGPCDQSLPVAPAARAGGVFGLIMAVIGGVVGGVMGHETRYEIARP